MRQRNRAVELDMVKVSRCLHRQTQAGRSGLAREPDDATH